MSGTAITALATVLVGVSTHAWTYGVLLFLAYVLGMLLYSMRFRLTLLIGIGLSFIDFGCNATIAEVSNEKAGAALNLLYVISGRSVIILSDVH